MNILSSTECVSHDVNPYLELVSVLKSVIDIKTLQNYVCICHDSWGKRI